MPDEKLRGRTPRVPIGREPASAPTVRETRSTPTGRGPVRHAGQGAAGASGAALRIMAVFLVIAGIASALLTVWLHNRSVDTTGVSAFAPATHAIVITVDGIDPGTLKHAPMPNLKALQQNGVTYSGAWVGQMETTAAASAATIGTGAFPSRHGIVGDTWYDARSKRLTRATLPENVLVGSVDSVMEPTGVDSISSAVKERRPSARVLSVAGTNCGAAAAAGTWTADFVVCAQRRNRIWAPISVAGHELPPSAGGALGITTGAITRGTLAAEMQGWAPGAQDHWIAREAVAAMHATRPRLTFVSFPEIGIMRRNVPTARAAAVEQTVMRGLDVDIGRLIHESKREGTYTSTIFVVTAGRAFEPIRARISYSHLYHAIIAAGGEATYLAGDNAALIGLRDPLQAQPVAQALQAENSNLVDAVYFKTSSGRGWSYSPQYLNVRASGSLAQATSYLLSTMASAQSPDVVVAYRPYAGLGRIGGNAGAPGALGMSWPIQHVPLIVAGHGAYAGRTSTFPARLVDIAPTLEYALGLPVSGRDGRVLKDALYGDSAGGVTQSPERSRFAPLVTALRTRSAQATR